MQIAVKGGSGEMSVLLAPGSCASRSLLIFYRKKKRKNTEERKADRPLAFSVAAGRHSQEAYVDPHLLYLEGRIMLEH